MGGASSHVSACLSEAGVSFVKVVRGDLSGLGNIRVRYRLCCGEKEASPVPKIKTLNIDSNLVFLELDLRRSDLHSGQAAALNFGLDGCLEAGSSDRPLEMSLCDARFNALCAYGRRQC